MLRVRECVAMSTDTIARAHTLYDLGHSLFFPPGRMKFRCFDRLRLDNDGFHMDLDAGVYEFEFVSTVSLLRLRKNALAPVYVFDVSEIQEESVHRFVSLPEPQARVADDNERLFLQFMQRYAPHLGLDPNALSAALLDLDIDKVLDDDIDQPLLEEDVLPGRSQEPQDDPTEPLSDEDPPISEELEGELVNPDIEPAEPAEPADNVPSSD